jgi:hypothetical protein
MKFRGIYASPEKPGPRRAKLVAPRKTCHLIPVHRSILNCRAGTVNGN